MARSLSAWAVKKLVSAVDPLAGREALLGSREHAGGALQSEQVGANASRECDIGHDHIL